MDFHIHVPVSIRSPHRSKGRPLVTYANPTLYYVSIRSPHRSKGRPATGAATDLGAAFQSAPLTEARGDCPIMSATDHLSSFNPLPSPKQGETLPEY